MTDMLIIIFSVLAVAAGYLWRRFIVKRISAEETPAKSQLRFKKLATFVIIAGAYVLSTKVIALVFGKPSSHGISVEIVAPRVDVLGFSLSTTVIYSWAIMAGLIIIALILRLTVVPRFKDVPKGAQNVIELAIETAVKYTKSTTHGVGEFLASYIFTIALFLVGCAFTEMLGFRTPASDITLTGALAILTFLFINIYGIKTKGVWGRVKSLANPTPVIFPIRLITDLAVPVSLACRLFGNMLGGLVVMDLLYTALGSYAVGFPSLAGLYFNVFHPLIQAFIFITLTLTFTNEAIEQEAIKQMYPTLPIGVGLCLLAAALSGLGMGIATGRAADAMARQPEASGKINAILLLGLAITESCAIYGFVTALILLFTAQ